MPPTKTPGQIAYEQHVRLVPRYPDGSARPSWDGLSEIAKASWENNPTTPRATTELTPIGEQYVIPGCEKRAPTAKGSQLDLWGGKAC